MSKKKPEKGLRGSVKAVLGLVGSVFCAFLYGLFEALWFQPSEPIFLTDSISFVPAEQPLLHAAFWATNLTLIMGACAFAMLLVGVSVRYGFFGLMAGSLMASLGAIAIGLLLFAPADEFDLGQKIVFSLIALVLGGLGGAFVVVWVRAKIRGSRDTREK